MQSITRHLALGLSFCLASVLTLTAEAQSQESAGVTQLDFEPKDDSRDRVVPLRVYLPPDLKSPAPVVLFSHGLGGSRAANPYLGNHWASHGLVSVFIQHAGSDQEVWRSLPARQRMSALKEAASAKSSQDRIQDVSFVIDQLERWNKDAAHPLFQKLDLEHIGMSGHSFGAVTTLAVTGRKFVLGRQFREPRIDAFLAMSPQPGLAPPPRDAFGGVTVPVLCMTGTLDDSPINDSTTPASRREVYKAFPAGDKYELVFEAGHHYTFSDGDRRQRDSHHHPAIQKISLKFWQTYLLGDDEAKQWLQSEAPKTDGTLQPNDVWQWK